MDLTGVLDKLKTLGGQLEAFTKQLDTNDNGLVKVGERVGTIEATMKAVQEGIANIEKKIASSAHNLLPGFEDEIKQNGPINPITAMFDPDSRDASFVQEYTRKRSVERGDRKADVEGGKKRDMVASDDAKGAIFIPHVALPGYIDKIRERSLLWNAGEGPQLTVMNGLTGFPVEIPTLTDDVTVAPAAENEAPTASDIAVGLLKFEPRAIKSLTKLSKRLIRMGPVAEQIVRLSAQKKFALEVDRWGFRGTGTNKESLGVVNTPGILSTAIGTNGGNFTLGVARAMKHKLRQNNVVGKGSMAYVGHPDPFYTAQTEKILQYSGDTAGDYLMLPMTPDQLTAMIGPWFDSNIFPANLTKGTNTTACEVIFGAWEDLWLGVWEDLVFSVADQAGDSFEKSMIWIKSELEIDFQVAQPLSFVLCNDANSVIL